MIRYYSELEDVARGFAKLSEMNSKSNPMMPVVIEVDGKRAAFGIVYETKINGVDCMVVSGTEKTMKNITPANRKWQIKNFGEGKDK